MNKYINVDKLIAKIKARQSELVEYIKTDTSSEKAIDGSKTVELQWVLDIIDSLQEEAPDKETILRICKLHKTWSIMAPWENVEDFVRTNWDSENIV